MPHLGIFAQTDPIGQQDDPNLYAYVGADPMNLVDPLGLTGTAPPPVVEPNPMIITGRRRTTQSICDDDPSLCGRSGPTSPPSVGIRNPNPITVTGTRRPQPRLPRQLNGYERRVLACSGVDTETLDQIVLVGFLPPFAYFTPKTQAQTLPGGAGSIGIFLRNGNASGQRNSGQMALIAHEVSHAMGYSRGVSLADILWSYGAQGYEASDPEVTARAFSDRVMNNIKSGLCR